jgi:hypothetical protein
MPHPLDRELDEPCCEQQNSKIQEKSRNSRFGHNEGQWRRFQVPRQNQSEAKTRRDRILKPRGILKDPIARISELLMLYSTFVEKGSTVKKLRVQTSILIHVDQDRTPEFKCICCVDSIFAKLRTSRPLKCLTLARTKFDSMVESRFLFCSI